VDSHDLLNFSPHASENILYLNLDNTQYNSYLVSKLPAILTEYLGVVTTACSEGTNALLRKAIIGALQ